MPEPGSEEVFTSLAHRTGHDVEQEGTGEDLVRTITTYYALTRIWVRRPTDGFRRMTTIVRCSECAKELRCIGYSPDRTRRRRRRQLAIGWFVLFPAVAAWCFTGFKFAQYGNAPVQAVPGLFFFALLLGGAVLFWWGITLIRSDKDLSIRLHGDRLHSIREDGTHYDVSVRGTPPVPF